MTRDDGYRPVVPTTSNDVGAISTTIVVSASDNGITTADASGELVPSETIKMQMRYGMCRRIYILQ